ncbi:Methylene-tetrahydrofolate reductase C terminal [Acetitomaculum ruminis DSM 5522]|uniref:Methylene-tetrahydrofolate reductase C terminal n=1 Tax=Acetitomaculum ruminis DSM 5522 TaxID=1120918 RepID=A0A1I0UYY5_9FIRM|nr:methylenetetrahydrofolate reductase C-terminal domain-containing protein [Acetitomaculum ruminis]SFA69304.1 Methylene-tetrahydrofolate reductase C terminal [Acetitomaculum ruminis DSM 5522]
MIITKKKPIEEVMASLEGVKKVGIVGCGSCATACETGGATQVEELKKYLEEKGFEVVGTVIPDECCQKLLVKKEVKVFKDNQPEAIVCMSCGNGVQTVGLNVNIPVYPSSDTLFLGMGERVGKFVENCRLCGQCVLASTGAVCPITKCAKSLVNGPCGGQKNGKCEVNPDNDCAWILIHDKLKELGQLDKLKEQKPDKGYSAVYYPRRYSAKEDN